MTTTSQPKLVTSIAELREVLSEVRCAGKHVGLVPTMGALHEGHLSLVRASKAECDYAVVSIYVNPSQFGPNEDLEEYPRVLEEDLQALADCTADLAFAPTSEEVYGAQHATWVEVGSVAEPLEGRCRPGHFRGVATIVLKLLNMVQPHAVYFGQKDYQQALVVRRMIEDLNLPVEMRVCPIVREPDGLAMSSRNAYLSRDDRKRSLVLWNSLRSAAELVAGGQRRADAIVQQMKDVIATAGEVRIDYVALVDPETLEPVDEFTGRTLAAVAVTIGSTRLIDNQLLEPPWF